MVDRMVDGMKRGCLLLPLKQARTESWQLYCTVTLLSTKFLFYEFPLWDAIFKLLLIAFIDRALFLCLPSAIYKVYLSRGFSAYLCSMQNAEKMIL